MTQPLYTVRQLAYVVRDLDAALKYWTEVLKVGPFFRFDHCPLLDQKFYGKPSNTDVTLALGNSGDAAKRDVIEPLLRDASPLVRAMAVWALAQLVPDAIAGLRAVHLPGELDTAVRGEWLA